MLRVDDVWEALTTQFQCFHQLIQNWAKSSTTAVMPRLTGVEGMQAATSQLQRAEFTAVKYRKIDPAWSPYLSVDGASAAAAPKPDDHPLSPQISSALSNRTTSAGAARGDGVRKTKAIRGFPTHVDQKLLCNAWRGGRDCPYGAQCNRYCYLTKGQDMYKKR
jgi:hypothetical protein